MRTLDLSLPNCLRFATMSKKPNGKRLNEHQRCEIISKLSKTNAPRKRALTKEYSVSEGAIQKVWDIREVRRHPKGVGHPGGDPRTVCLVV